VAADVQVHVYLADGPGRQQEAARARCLTQLVNDLLKTGARRLVLDSRGDRDRYDVRTLQAALGAYPAATQLTYEHLDSAHELLIGVADMIGWAYGAGGDWRRRITPALASVNTCT
jgi:hypothetical protein